MPVVAESVLRTAGAAGVPTFQLAAGGPPSPVRWVTELPADLAGATPLVRVSVFGGQGEPIWTFTNPRVDFDCFAATREDARALAYAVRHWFITVAPGEIYSGAVLTRVDAGSEPLWAPWDNTSLRRFVWTTQFRLHAQGAA